MKKKFQADKVLVLSAGHLLHDIYSSFLAPLLPLLVRKLGITLSMAGMLDVVRNSPSLLNPFFGMMVDRIRLKYFVIFTPAVTAIVMSLLGIAPSYAVLLIMVFVTGISAVLFHIPTPVLIKRFSADKTGTGMSFYMLGGELSRTLGPLVITAAVTAWGLDGTWRLIPFGIAASSILFFKLRDFDTVERSGTEGRGIKRRKVLRELVPHFFPLGGFLFFITAMKVVVTLYLPAYFVDQGQTLIRASFFLAVLQFAGAVGTLIAGYVSDRIGRKNTLFISGLVCPLLLWLFTAVDGGLKLPVLAVLGFFLFSSGPVVLTLVQDASPKSPSFANGIFMTMSFLIRSIIVFFTGYLIERVGYDFTYKVCAVAALGALPCILFIRERGKPGRGVKKTIQTNNQEDME